MLPGAEEILDPEAARKFEDMALFKNTVQKSIEDIETDNEQQVIEEVKKSPYFAVQFDLSTDVSRCAIFLCFAGYKRKTDFKEKLLCCVDLLRCTTGSEKRNRLGKLCRSEYRCSCKHE